MTLEENGEAMREGWSLGKLGRVACSIGVDSTSLLRSLEMAVTFSSACKA